MFSIPHISIIVVCGQLFFLGIWLYAFSQANDFSVPTKMFPKDVHKILVVFPHADDELLTCGGVLQQLSNGGKEVYWIVLTKGERGNEDAHFDENLAMIREKEAREASQIYGVKLFIQLDYPDYSVEERRAELRQDLYKKIKEIHPNLIITYDKAGLYGHPDHIVTSEVITDLIEKEFSDIHLWYATFPKKLLHKAKLPEEMADNLHFKDKRSYPTIKIFVGLSGVRTKNEVLNVYKSQQNSYRKSFPIKFLPSSFYVSLMQYEYFSEVK